MAATAAVAALTPEQTIQEGLRREDERRREQQRLVRPKADELKTDPERARKPEFPSEARCFAVHEMSLAGPDAARFSWLLNVALPYLGRCVGVQGLSFIASRLDQKLGEMGYVTTRVSLPPQNLQSGTLLIQIEVGRVADIRMVHAGEPSGAMDTPDQRWGTWRNAFPVGAGDVLDVRALEQGVENMKRLPSQDVATRLEPGEAPNASVVLIQRSVASLQQRVRGGLTLDNSGSALLGRTQLSANLALDNPVGLNDVLSASVNSNAEQVSGSRHSQSASLNYSLPWGYNLASLGVSRSRFAQYVQGTTARFLSSGRSENADLRLQRIVWRSASSKTGVYAALSTRSAWSFLDDTEVLVQRRRSTTLETGLNHKQLWESSSLELDLGYRRGMPWRGAQEDFPSAGAGGLTLRPRTWTFNLAYTADFSVAARSLQYSASARGQHTKNTTLSIDQIAIGGRASVRGFDGDAVLLAESGVIVRNEFSTPIKLWEGINSNAVLAVDWGRVWGPSDALLVGNKLAGLALGLKGRVRSWQFDATLATPLARPTGFTSRNTSLYASLTHIF